MPSSSSPSPPSRRSRYVAGLTAAAVVAGGAATAVASDTEVVPAPRVRSAAATGVRPAPAEPLIDDIARIKAHHARAAAEAAVADVPPEPREVVAAAEAEVATAPARTVWDDLADCESGDWDGAGNPVVGTATWTYAAGYFEGGLQFAPRTWDAFRGDGMPGHAGQASRAQQIATAERVLAAQGWRAWPVCSRKLGLR